MRKGEVSQLMLLLIAIILMLALLGVIIAIKDRSVGIIGGIFS